MQLNAEMSCALDVPKNAFEHGEMNIPRRMHVKANLLHYICDVGAGDRQIL